MNALKSVPYRTFSNTKNEWNGHAPTVAWVLCGLLILLTAGTFVVLLIVMTRNVVVEATTVLPDRDDVDSFGCACEYKFGSYLPPGNLLKFVLLEVVRGDQISTVFGDAADLYGDLAAQAMVSKINTDARLLEQTTLISFSSNTTDTSRDIAAEEALERRLAGNLFAALSNSNVDEATDLAVFPPYDVCEVAGAQAAFVPDSQQTLYDDPAFVRNLCGVLYTAGGWVSLFAPGPIEDFPLVGCTCSSTASECLAALDPLSSGNCTATALGTNMTATGSCSDTLTIVSDVCQKAFSENLVNAAFGFLVGAASQDFTGNSISYSSAGGIKLYYYYNDELTTNLNFDGYTEPFNVTACERLTCTSYTQETILSFLLRNWTYTTTAQTVFTIVIVILFKKLTGVGGDGGGDKEEGGEMFDMEAGGAGGTAK